MPHRFTITRSYFRVVFTNTSASNQTYLRIQTTVGDKEQLNAPLDGTLAQDFDAFVTRPTDFTSEVALGLRQGLATWNKFGYNTDVDTTTDPEIIANFGGAYTATSVSSVLNIRSSSANDTSGGTGVNSLVLFGVDDDWDLVTEVVTLNGTTNVTTTNSYIGVNRMTIYTSGSSNSNVGTITATSSAGTTMAQMNAN